MSDDEEVAIERRNVVRLIRVMAGFVAFPSLTTGLAFIVYEGLTKHWMHNVALSLAFVAAMAAFVMAPRIAERSVTSG